MASQNGWDATIINRKAIITAMDVTPVVFLDDEAHTMFMLSWPNYERTLRVKVSAATLK